MRIRIIGICLAFAFVASPVLAQTSQNGRSYENGRLKLLIGIGLMGTGALAVATARTNAVIPLANAPNVEISDWSTGRLVFGLAMLGGGGYLAMNGHRQMRAARPTLEFGIGTDRVVIRRTW